MGDRLRGHDETIGERLARDLAAFTKPLPPPYDACEKLRTTVSLAVAGALPPQRLLGADELWSP